MGRLLVQTFVNSSYTLFSINTPAILFTHRPPQKGPYTIPSNEQRDQQSANLGPKAEFLLKIGNDCRRCGARKGSKMSKSGLKVKWVGGYISAYALRISKPPASVKYHLLKSDQFLKCKSAKAPKKYEWLGRTHHWIGRVTCVETYQVGVILGLDMIDTLIESFCRGLINCWGLACQCVECVSCQWVHLETRTLKGGRDILCIVNGFYIQRSQLKAESCRVSSALTLSVNAWYRLYRSYFVDVE